MNIQNKHAVAAGSWLIALGVAALVHRSSVWALVAGIYLTYKTFDAYLSHDIFTSKLYRLVTITLLYTLIIQSVIVSVWMVSHNISLQQIPLITAVLLVIMRGILFKFGPTQSKSTAPELPSRQFANRYDITAIVVMLVVSFFVVVPSLYRGGYHPSNVIKLVNANVDDASHLALFNDHLDRDRGVLTGISNPQNLRNATMYPASWHSLNAMIVRGVDTTIQIGSQSLVAYAITKVFWFMVLLYLAFRLGLQLWGNSTYKGALTWMECATLVIIAGYFAQVLVHTFIEGFYSFIPQIIYGILLLSLIAQLQIRKKSADIETSFAQTYPLLFLAALGGSLTWFLPLPALIIFLVILALGYLVGKHWRQTTKSLVRASLAFMPVYFLAALAVLVQYHVLATDKSPGSVGFFQGLLLNGGITIYDPTFYLLFGIGLVAFFVMIRRASNQKNAMANGSLLFFACMMAFISVIYIYQQLKLNTNVYYYYKLVYLLLAIATPLVVTGYAYLIQRIAGSPRRVLLYAVLFFCLLLNFVGIEPTLTRNPISTYPAYLLGKRKITPAYDEVIYQNLRNVSTEKAFSDNNYFFMYTVGKPQIDTASLLLRTNKPISPCSEAVRSTFIVAADIYTTDKTAQSACVGRQIYLVVSDADKQTLGKLSLQKLRVITYAQAEGHSPL